MSIIKEVPVASPPAEITITVTRFKAVLARGTSRTSPGTDYRMKLRKKHPRVRIEGRNIVVRPPAVTLRFTIASAAGDRQKYYPVGITFRREGSSDEQRLGFLNFAQSQIHPDGSTLSVVDSYREAGPVRYKFSVVIQRGADGAIGIIDPGIDHEGDQ